MNQREVIQILKKAGWVQVKGGKGSHQKLVKEGKTTEIPHNKDLPTGTLKAIEKETGIKLK